MCQTFPRTSKTRKRVRRPYLFLLVLARAAAGQSLDVPLTVEETAGSARVAEPVTFGVPLPKGAVRDPARLVLYGTDGKPVPAAFRVVNRWWDDAATQLPSIQWVHADFFAEVAAGGRSVYRLRLSDGPSPNPKASLRVETRDDRVMVDTGTVAFTVNRTGPLLEAPGLRDVDFLLRSDERIYKASQWPGSELVVEEQNR